MAHGRCVMVLGGGHSADGLTLSERSRERVERAVRLFGTVGAGSLICSGAYSIALPAAPAQTEAALMAELAVARGIPREAIVLEEQSLDTIGNIAVVGATILPRLEPERVWLVTSDYHLRRVRYLVRRMWGARVQVDFESALSGISPIARLKRAIREYVLLRKARKVLRGFPEGDPELIVSAWPLNTAGL